MASFRYLDRNALDLAPVAQLDRALPSEGRGQGFESLRARQIIPIKSAFLTALEREWVVAVRGSAATLGVFGGRIGLCPARELFDVAGIGCSIHRWKEPPKTTPGGSAKLRLGFSTVSF
jgi:hypothetical protein